MINTNGFMYFNSNKGFTLLEFIIVIAIIVELVVFLDPQYMRFVEKSHVSTDEQVAQEVYYAVAATCCE